MPTFVGATATKAGHAGTLDPLATGLLLVLLGKGTRLARYLVGLDKRYRTEIRLGLRTSTGDGEGEIVEETPVAGEEEILALEGDVELPVPAASAVKIGGERAYALHRRGVAVEMPVRALHDSRASGFAATRLRSSSSTSTSTSGTYVRAIADALGGHCRWLRRTAVGPFRVEDAEPERVLPLLAALVHLPERRLDDDEAAVVRTGARDSGSGEGPVALWTGDGELVAVGQAAGGEIRPETVLG